MKKIAYDLLYLSGCGVNQLQPEKDCLKDYQDNLKKLYLVSKEHQIDACVGATLKKAGIPLPKEWEEQIARNIRKNLLFDIERTRILSWMENCGIWYLPLKGILMKQYYPEPWMRQMSDQDILYDVSKTVQLKEYMVSQGYCAVVGKGVHDVYQKPPVFHFEFHRALYNSNPSETWAEYYRHIKGRLIQEKKGAFGYRMRREDFYVYLVSHSYKHYAGSGTGIRTLLDTYVYLCQEEPHLDFSYVEQECGKLGILEYEQRNRMLCKKLFSMDVCIHYDPERLDSLSETEKQMLREYLLSGVYGNTDQKIKKRISSYQKDDGSIDRITYIKDRLFPDEKFVKSYHPFVHKHRWLYPFLWIYRLVRGMVCGKRRKKIWREIQAFMDFHTL